jgi:hypothetical protein
MFRVVAVDRMIQCEFHESLKGDATALGPNSLSKPSHFSGIQESGFRIQEGEPRYTEHFSPLKSSRPPLILTPARFLAPEF